MIKSIEENMKEFSKEVELRVVTFKMGYMEAIIDICEEREMEFSTAKRIMSDHIKSRLYEEAMEKNFIDGAGALPL